jgi:DNA-binding CsgD family transcriptional regulator
MGMAKLKELTEVDIAELHARSMVGIKYDISIFKSALYIYVNEKKERNIKNLLAAKMYFCDKMKCADIADSLSVSYHTANSYIKRFKREMIRQMYIVSTQPHELLHIGS